MSADVILPGATLGVLGGGQLGRMFVQSAQAMGYFTAVLDAPQAWSATTTSAPATRTRRAWPSWRACRPPSPPNSRTCPLRR
jgi:D-arabinose 1-dehydrogenase-like Zn-dependent alcohol dehydrogenase